MNTRHKRNSVKTVQKVLLLLPFGCNSLKYSKIVNKKIVTFLTTDSHD